jgi:hypothetical protein
MYLYRNRRVDGKPVKEYIASRDQFGFWYEWEDRLERIRKRVSKLRKLEREAEVKKRTEIDQLLRAVEVANADLRILVEGILYAIGFHKHKRGEWRMNRIFMKELQKRIDNLKEQVEAHSSPLINYQAPDDELFVMNARGVLPRVATGVTGSDGLWNVVVMRHPYIRDAILDSFWIAPKKSRTPLIIPVRPDNQLGRIGQQSSCFRMHMHNSTDCQNITLEKIKVPADKKDAMLTELHRMNINHFTIYNDLDHLSKSVKQFWGVA